jgi:hypothetical protein
VETLFTRGIPLSTSQTYASILNPIGPYNAEAVSTSVIQDMTSKCNPWSQPGKAQFLEWSFLPLSTIYDKYFYGVNPNDLLNELLFLQSEINIQPIESFLSLNASTVSTFASVSSLNASSIYGFSTSLIADQSTSIERYNHISTVLVNASSIILELSTNFYKTQFTPLSNTLMQRGDYYYLKRPDPLPTPVPWYWQGLPERYVGPSLSSMYISSQCNAPLIASYCDTLVNTSTAWYTSNTTIVQSEIEAYIALTTGASNYVDNASSLSTYFETLNTSFANSLRTEFYGNNVSTLSTSLTTYFKTYRVPSDGPYISTGASSMFAMNSTLNSTLLGHVSSGVLGDHISTFSTTTVSTIGSLVTFLYIQNNIQTMSTLNTVYTSTLVSTLDLLSVSTNQKGYESLSTLYPVIFSTFAHVLPYIVLSNTQLNDLSTVMGQAAAVSSILNPQMSSILGLNASFQTASGISSIYFNLSTSASTFYTDYCALLSTPSSLLGYSTSIMTNELNAITAYYSNLRPILNYSTLANTTRFTRVDIVSDTNAISTLGCGTVRLEGSASVKSIHMSNIDIYTTGAIINPPRYSIQSVPSSIQFNEAFIVKHLFNSTLTGLIGINTLNPSYALDVVGDARKISGTAWINPSDQRIKDTVIDAGYMETVEKIMSLRLVSYTWDESYRVKHDLHDAHIMGFLSQEVEKVFPEAVSVRAENGYPDFRSLDADQLMKAKYRVTLGLLERFNQVECRISSLLNTLEE